MAVKFSSDDQFFETGCPSALCVVKVVSAFSSELHCTLYNNQATARALIGQSAMFIYCASKLMEKSPVF